MSNTLTCSETGKQFIGRSDGFTFNYAHGPTGEIVSDEGVDIRERRQLLDRSKTYYCYLSSDGKHITGWKGNVLGEVITFTRGRVGFCQNGCYVIVNDVHGGMWYGRNSGRGMFLKLKAYK